MTPSRGSHWPHISIATLCTSLFLATAQAAEPLFDKASNDSLLWGPYRPNLYFGLRPRLPKSVLTGLLWARVEDFQTVQNNFRHTCEQHEGMAGYGWDAYDSRTGGVQTIHDSGNSLDLTTEFVKFPGGTNGGSWGARIRGTPQAGASADLKTAVVFYAAVEGLGSLEAQNVDEGENQERGFEGDVVINGQTPDLGEFKMVISEGKGKRAVHSHPSGDEKGLERTFVHSVQIPEEALWQAKPILFSSMKTTIDAYIEQYGQEKMPPPWQTYTIQNRPGQGNMHMIQKVFEGPFEFDVVFSSTSAEKLVTSEDITSKVKSITSSFSERFLEVLKPQPPFTRARYEEFSKSLFSNLVGGIGYFYGDAVVDRSYAPEYDEENEGFWQQTAEARARNQQKLEGPYELFTSIPSRPFFPRGFLWDEGFHLLPIIDWDVDLTLQIIKSWFNLMDENGWIGREQILGAEARSKVPAEFQVQYPHYANPPTLFLVLDAFIDKLSSAASPGFNDQQPMSSGFASSAAADPEAAKQYLRDLYPLLKRHYEWYRSTQWGDIKSYDREAFSSKEAYRWRGRTPAHILTSGLDDYPRPQPPHPGELHVDLMSWMGMMTRSMKRIADTIADSDEAAEYAKIEEAIVRNIDDLHWDKKEKTYCDATIDDYEESVHVCHKGYISIFPFMTGLLAPDSKRLGAVLELIADKEELWSEHGIRSLSRRDELYGTEENYWRSPVWINMNYLIVRELLKVAQSPGPHQKQARSMYTKLRINLVETVYTSWEETGFAWEQYNPESGAGQRTQHFTGWTSLVVKIMAMPDLGGKSGHDEL
ncbi:Processing alpha glucosidase I [Elasticomyces elasticus]|nr:Processing alpha glucosidase I [Elasticomyces elasticus]